ncbi:MAG: hypothetical protein AB8B80_11700 [Marinicellaceae bacterium]
MKKIAVVSLICILTSACTSRGTIQGISEQGSVKMDYEQGVFDNDGQLKVMMPDGELFLGKFVQSSSSEFADSLILNEGLKDDAWILSGSDRVSSQTQAQLISRRGNTMECHFQLSKPDSGIKGGGIGKCLTSNDQKVTVTF